MGVLNVTPDSFSDGGKYIHADSLLKQAESMINAGADILDIGGESTRPGAMQVSPAEELNRVLPALEKIKANFDIRVSVDTSTPEVMREAAALGVWMINDVRALSREGALEAASRSGLKICLMHMQGQPETMQHNPDYLNVEEEVKSYLSERVELCLNHGVSKDRLFLDPGIGFGKSLEHNLTLLGNLSNLAGLGFPLLVGASRKSMIGQITGREVHGRLAGSLGAAVMAAVGGAAIVRVHDVAETVDALRVADAIIQTGRK